MIKNKLKPSMELPIKSRPHSRYGGSVLDFSETLFKKIAYTKFINYNHRCTDSGEKLFFYSITNV